MTDLFMSDLFITNTKDHPCISPPVYKPPPLYKPIKNHLRKYISPGLIVGGLRYQCKIRGINLILHWYGGEHLMLHIEAGVQTLSYTDIGVKNLCYVKGQGYKPYLTLIWGWTPYVTYRGRGINLILHWYRGEELMLRKGARV
jgi:hypothetical protein